MGFYYGDVRSESCSVVCLVCIICDNVLGVRSARSRSSLVVVTSAETVTLDFLASAVSKSFFARVLGLLLARSL